MQSVIEQRVTLIGHSFGHAEYIVYPLLAVINNRHLIVSNQALWGEFDAKLSETWTLHEK